jgi:hypothetical protein
MSAKPYSHQVAWAALVVGSSTSQNLRNLSFSMYGPPRDCKGKVWMKKVCVNVSGLFVEVFILLAMMRYAASLSYKIPRLFESHLRNQVSGAPF